MKTLSCFNMSYFYLLILLYKPFLLLLLYYSLRRVLLDGCSNQVVISLIALILYLITSAMISSSPTDGIFFQTSCERQTKQHYFI